MLKNNIQYCSHPPEKCGLNSCKYRGCILNDPPIKPWVTLDKMVENYWSSMERLGLGEFKDTSPVVLPMPSAAFFKSIEKKSDKKHVVTRKHHRTRFKHLIVDEIYVPCHYCAALLICTQTSMDHIIPKSKGGGLSGDNIVPACHDCNIKKGSMEYYEFLWKAKGMGIKLRPERLEEYAEKQRKLKWA